jgi:hypothetical protein
VRGSGCSGKLSERSAPLYFAFEPTESELACSLKERIRVRYSPYFFPRVEPLLELFERQNVDVGFDTNFKTVPESTASIGEAKPCQRRPVSVLGHRSAARLSVRNQDRFDLAVRDFRGLGTARHLRASAIQVDPLSTKCPA